MEPRVLLAKLFTGNSPPHALLFSGLDGISKKETAINLTRYLFHEDAAEFMERRNLACRCKSCVLIVSKTHPDFFEIDEFPISIGQIRRLKERFASTATLASWKIAVLPDVETMTLEAANAFLKLLEEPRGNALFMLFAKSRSSVLSTIASRALEIRFPGKNSIDKPGADSLSENLIQAFETGSLIEKFQIAKMYSLKNKGELLLLLDEWLMYLRQKLFEGERKVQIAKKIFMLKQILSITNANPQLLLEELLLNN